MNISTLFETFHPVSNSLK